MSWKAVNWKRGVLRIWALFAICWIGYGIAFSEAGDEVRYSYRYFVERESLRLDMLSRGVCTNNPYVRILLNEQAAQDALKGDSKPTDPQEVAGKAEENCLAHLSGREGAQKDCKAVFAREYLDAVFAAKRAEQLREAEILAKEKQSEAECRVSFLPNPPSFQNLAATFLLPTIGVGLLFIVVGLLYLLGRWIVAGFKPNP